MKFFLLLLGSIFIFSNGMAQIETEQQTEAQPDELQINVSEIYGKLISNNTNLPVEAASVRLYLVEEGKPDSLVNGMLSRPNGDFRFSKLPSSPVFRVVVSALGFEDWKQDVIINDQKGKGTGFKKDIGNIHLELSVKQLKGVVVTTRRPSMEMGIDRKIFNVDKNITSVGGTAVDVMKNIPSVSVDIEGNVELRNSTPQIFIDGRPTILTLDQIPAENIESVELITNPSAKFDAASSGGIINVVLKKNKRVGLNGLVTVSGGTPKLFSNNLSLNLRQGKINFFASGDYNRSGGKTRGQTLRQNKDNGIITDYFNQNSVNERSRKFSSIRFGVDFFADNRNTFSLSQNFVQGSFENNETQSQEQLDNTHALLYYGQRKSDGKSGFNRESTKLSYKHSFPEPGKELTADLNYNYGKRSDDNYIENSFFYPDGSTYQPKAIVRNEGNGNQHQVTFQADYVNPITERSKFETGVRFYQTRFVNFYDAFAQDNGQDVKLPLSNNYQYTENINAAYATYSGKNEKETFSYQFGLRLEHSRFNGNLVDSAYKFGYEYPNNIGKLWNAIFPSFFLSRKVGEDNEFQFNYTRRIRRPRFWELNPFVDINDPINLRKGNPELKPEFINSLEFNYNLKYKNGSLLSVLYFRNNPNDITQYSDTISSALYQQLNNAAIDPNAILNTFINAGITNRYGAEFTLQHKIGNNFDITPTFNLQYRTVRARIGDLNLSNKGFNWQAKLNTNYKIETENKSVFNNLGFQLSGEYESPRVIPQGKQLAQYYADFAVRKDFLKNKKATLVFAVNDIFNSRKWGTIYDTDQFYQDSYRRWNVRSFRLTFTFKFGDANFSLVRKSARQNQNELDL